jgi:hypothetical protein
VTPEEVLHWLHARIMEQMRVEADEARATERRAVVAWLRKQGMAPYAQSNLDYAATMIERGEHLTPETTP